MVEDRLIQRTERRRTFHTLDALRGAAAIAVVAFHYPELLTPVRFDEAYLAVDLFFLISGVVIAHAYGKRFDAGLRPAAFLLARVVRLYPLFALGVLISIGSIAAALLAGLPSRWTWTGLATALPNLLFLPSPPIPGRSAELYPLDFPAWSLLYELIANLALVVAWKRWQGVWLAWLIAAAAVLLVIVTIRSGRLDGGTDVADVLAGLARVFFSFFAGVALLRGEGRLPILRLPSSVIVLTALALLLVPVPQSWRVVYDLTCVFLLFPVLIWAAIHSEPPFGTAGCAFLGLISYPLYTLHIPAKLLVIGASRKLLGEDPTRFAPAIGIGALALLVAASWFAARYLDSPLRRLAGSALGTLKRRDAPDIQREQRTGR